MSLFQSPHPPPPLYRWLRSPHATNVPSAATVVVPASCTFSSPSPRHLSKPSTARLFHSSRRQRQLHPRSSSPAATPQAIADAFLSKFASSAPTVRKQLLDGNQVRLLSLTLDRSQLFPSSSSSPAPAAPLNLEMDTPTAGTPLPPGYHLVYFTPASLSTYASRGSSLLAPDGSDSSFNPQPPFTRRMWAGGSVSWPGAPHGHLLRVGDVVSETTRVLSCDVKMVRKTGEAMLVVRVQMEFRDGRDRLCVVDERNWVFREAIDPAAHATHLPHGSHTAAAAAAPPPTPQPQPPPPSSSSSFSSSIITRSFNRTNLQLFRFSALTFNGHRIHYDQPWAVAVEGHRDVVVHGPLNLVSMLDLWRDHHHQREPAATSGGGGGGDGDDGGNDGPVLSSFFPSRIDYRATSPVYAGEGYRILMEEEEGKEVDKGMGMRKEKGKRSVGENKSELRVVSDVDGTLCMKGTITY